MKTVLLLLIFLVGSFCIGCGPVVGEKVQFKNACDIGNEKRMIEVEGFLDASGSVFCSNIGGRMNCGLKLKDDPDSQNRGFSADVAVGTGGNSMDEVQRGYQPSDLVIRDNDGIKIDLGKKLRITGEQNVAENPGSKDPVCFMKVYKIEQ